MNRRRALLKIISSAVVGATAVFPTDRGHAANAGADIAAPDFDVIDAENRRRSLAEFRGKAVVLEWTSPSCPYVAAQYSSGKMQEVQKWATERGVVWLSVLSTHPSRRDYLPPQRAGEFIRSRMAAPTAVLLDSTGSMGRAYGARTTPHMFVISQSGALAYQGAIDSRPTVDAKVVASSTNFVRAALTDLAAGRPVATPSTRPYGCSVGYAA